MNILFDRDKTQILKGLALILMIFHHTIASGSWTENAPELYAFLVRSSKICVWIFAFLVGYGFYCSSNKSLKYSLKRIALLLIPFWVILCGIFIPASYFSGTLQGLELWDVIYNMFGISLSLNWYSWFVCFYILAILSLPYLHRIIKITPPRYGWLIVLLGYYVPSAGLHFLPNWDTNPLLYSLFNYSTVMPNVVLGFMCAKWNHEGVLPTWFEGKKKLPLCILVVIVVLLIPGLNIPTKGFPLHAFITPFFIFAIVGIFNSFQLKNVTSCLTKVGDLSMYMWFFHALFFTTTVNLYTKNLVFEPFHCFLYTFVMTFGLSYIASWIIKKLLTPIINRIK